MGQYVFEMTKTKMAELQAGPEAPLEMIDEAYEQESEPKQADDDEDITANDEE